MAFTRNTAISMLAFFEHPKRFAMMMGLWGMSFSVHLPTRTAFSVTIPHANSPLDSDERLDRWAVELIAESGHFVS